MKNFKWMFAVITTCLVLVSSPINANEKAEAAMMHSSETHKVDINQADAQTLADRLNGVGLKRAKAIVAYRKENGLFTSAEDLKKVKGVGASVLKKNAGIIEF